MQRYLWQQADGKRHVYDTARHRVQAGRPFTALCGETVTPQTERGDLTAGLWFDGECPVCTIALAKALGWPVREISDLAHRFDWSPALITRLAEVLHCSFGEVVELTGARMVDA
ncbi:zinc finger protein [Saccharomonospora viridis]|jgi:hypothetical protein|uniref:Zinc-finger n=2 Tax=Saccharomonospora viridis (strain ATCC 15386 / DSM 43017 / JCM 3036 / CCUG 5913 / NBRC 12207 / NCIMB 9602 / P101) TaxID=471857 RepID=C7MVX3_SACVD|nr:zinc finger protein [Saccharomonospora viridis]ACU97073.1 hypothetical protein Svir_20580 [Saccharomonospora viridis DSM 43017]